MARNKPTQGICAYCGQTFAKSGMTRHLGGCAERRKVLEQGESAPGPKETLFHLVIGDRWRSDYWLHLEMRGSARLEDLDGYLRAIWLECCGHLSSFSIGRFGDERSMSARADKLFTKTESLVHYYDYGTTSKTTIKVAGARTGKPTTKHPIALMARNLAPQAVCIACGKPASHLCLECVYEDQSEGALCADCLEPHPHHDYGEPLPLANSPRMGMCAPTAGRRNRRIDRLANPGRGASQTSLRRISRRHAGMDCPHPGRRRHTAPHPYAYRYASIWTVPPPAGGFATQIGFPTNLSSAPQSEWPEAARCRPTRMAPQTAGSRPKLPVA